MTLDTRQRVRRVANTVLPIVGAAVLVTLTFGGAKSNSEGVWLTTNLVVIYAVVYFLSILFHELGHVVGAWAGGFTIYRVYVLAVPLYRRRGSENYGLPQWTSSFVTALKANPSARDFKIFIFLGPAFTGLLTLASLTFLWFASQAHGFDQNPWFWVFATSASLNLLLLAYPMLVVNPATDYWLLRELKRDPEASLERISHAYFLYQLTGRPKDHDVEVIEKFKKAKGGMPQALMREFYMVHDQGDIDRAWKLIQDVYAELKKVEKPVASDAAIAFEMATFSAVIGGNSDLAFEAFSLGMQINPNQSQRKTAALAREYVWGDRQRALNGLQELRDELVRGQKSVGWWESCLHDWFGSMFPELREAHS